MRAFLEVLEAFRASRFLVRVSLLERAKGIEPSYAAWEAAVLPLNYARLSPFAFEHDLFGKPLPTFPDHAHLISRDRAVRQAGWRLNRPRRPAL
jgi:hypothetical protein